MLGKINKSLTKVFFIDVLAEEAGFEPATELPLCHLSRVVPSTAQPLFLIGYILKRRHYSS